MKHRRLTPLFLALLLALGCSSAETPSPPPSAEATATPPPVEHAVFRSKAYEIDRVYRSMRGPQARQEVRLGDPEDPQLVWITGYRSRIADPATSQVLSPEFMCHSNLSFSDRSGAEQDTGSTISQDRLFTLSQGQMEVSFPEGFGIPVVTTNPLYLDTQVLNLNAQEEPLRVRHETTVSFVRDEDLETPMRPLFQASAQAFVARNADEAHFGVENPDEAVHGAGCSVGMPAGRLRFEDEFGQVFAAHWIVEPGRHVTRTLATEWMDLPFDTKAHFIAIHLHPYAESLELRDLTTGETVFKSTTRQSEGRTGLEHVETYSSAEGIALYADHQYELITIYDNTSDRNQDAMAVMFLYLEDKQFRNFESPTDFGTSQSRLSRPNATNEPSA